ncbi:hypothetical protein NQZ68_008596 [Dissostichus eleginoides]|nr:hypothetical protein NQZ68_008596 [Dissostichus eleginoides]
MLLCAERAHHPTTSATQTPGRKLEPPGWCGGGGEHLVGQQSGFLGFLAHKGRMCALATLRRRLMEKREGGWRRSGRGGGGASLAASSLAVCQPLFVRQANISKTHGAYVSAKFLMLVSLKSSWDTAVITHPTYPPRFPFPANTLSILYTLTTS